MFPVAQAILWCLPPLAVHPAEATQFTLTPLPNIPEYGWQTAEMYAFVGVSDERPGFIDSLMQMGLVLGHTIDQTFVCNWTGVECNNDSFVYAIRWVVGIYRHLEIGTIDLRWLPSKIICVDITRQLRTSVIHTRGLPRSMTFIRLVDCHISGTIDLTTLPAKLQCLFMGNNPLSGTVRLTRLPKTIRQIDLLRSDVSTLIVDNTLLPASLREVLISRRFPWSVEVVSLDDTPHDKRIQFKESTEYQPIA